MLAFRHGPNRLPWRGLANEPDPAPVAYCPVRTNSQAPPMRWWSHGHEDGARHPNRQRINSGAVGANSRQESLLRSNIPGTRAAVLNS